MSRNYEKPQSLMKDLFPLAQPDLNVGLYGAIHAKGAEIDVGVAEIATSNGGAE